MGINLFRQPLTHKHDLLILINKFINLGFIAWGNKCKLCNNRSENVIFLIISLFNIGNLNNKNYTSIFIINVWFISDAETYLFYFTNPPILH